MSKKRHKKDDSNKKKTFVEQMASDPKQAAESESSSRSNESSESSETLKKSPSSRPSLSDLITAQIDTHGDEQARRTLIVDAWESRNEIYHQMFGAPSHSDPITGLRHHANFLPTTNLASAKLCRSIQANHRF